MNGNVGSKRSSSWTSDLKVLWHLLAHPVKGDTHAERLESFYRGQAEDYDAFRARLLHGRSELFSRLAFPSNAVWVDLGAGTGENLLFTGNQLRNLREIVLVDLSQSLLNVARQRIEQLGLEQARCLLADATELAFEPESVDVVTFSYSLTMIPDWFQAIEMAYRMLKPGGILAATDFYVSRKYAGEMHRQHGWLRRTFWSLWFASDNVFLSGDHPAMLHRKFNVDQFDERLGKVPYIPLARAPYYIFIGHKEADTDGG